MSIEKQKKRVSPTDTNKDNICTLELYNDDYHSFDYVIESLIEICEMDSIQAIQCTYLVHYKGKCDVKRGSKPYLMPMRRALSKRDLRAIIK